MKTIAIDASVVLKWYLDDESHGSEALTCLLYTSDDADDLLCLVLGGRHILKNKK